MAVAPLPPAPSTSPTPAAPPMSEASRILNTFIAPSKTFTDLRRSALWWAPFVLMAIISMAFVYTVDQKIGFRKVTENQVAMSPKQSAQLDNMPADQREQQMRQRTTGTEVISYLFPAVMLIIWLVIAALMFATFKFAAGADVTFSVSLAIVIFAALPGVLKTVLAMLSVVAGMSPDSFSFQNPVATNPGYFMNPAENVFLYSVASSLDIFLIWTLVLTAIGFTCVSKVKRGTSFAIVFGWWGVFTLAGAALASAFS